MQKTTADRKAPSPDDGDELKNCQVSSERLVEGRFTPFLGRFMICKALVDLLEASVIELVPDKGLAAIADELETEKAYERTLGVYRRMLEVTQVGQDVLQIKRRIKDAEAKLAIMRDTEHREVTRPDRLPCASQSHDDVSQTVFQIG